MSLSGCDQDGNWSITIKNVGECTNAMYNLKIGDFIGIRGPLGNHFKIPNQEAKKNFLSWWWNKDGSFEISINSTH